ncbi:hypothetical protein FOCC_FOCC005781 [Frankliniella occidentalis]|uniref:Coiled-coil domain-containing protein 85C n=1 Tax=Frankliniella occidentalis TaxID=133901 RepID=A0A6J1SRU8_FRAOC|nr:coiled-coil domain-containing protein 85C [Frankliniella occidentalis]KAE8747450.1 hypothetical protein FOCC_FOCC005781 [Frankliniella occidentalis]
MSNKKPAYINKAPPPPVDVVGAPAPAPPRYQPPPQVTGPSTGPGHGPGILKHYQPQPPPPAQPSPLPQPPPPLSKDAVKTNHIEGPPKQTLMRAPSYPHPPQYPAPPAVSGRRPNPIVGLPAPQRPNDEELLRLGPVEMLKFVRKSEGEAARAAAEQGQAAREAARVAAEQGQAARDAGRHMQGLATEVRALKEANQRLSDDNQELRDLCCFLDDDRQKGRKLAREWQRFGRYTASVMRQEVSAYQNKLRELDTKQHELIKDNLELKELCLYLDEERNQNQVCPHCGTGLRPSQAQRDDGDGSSSSTNADEPAIPSQFVTPNPGQPFGTTSGGSSANNVSYTGPSTPTSHGMNVRRSESRERLLEESIQRQRTVFNDQMMQYVRSLEQRVKTLEEEKRVLCQKLCGAGINPEQERPPGWDLVDPSSRPEAVVQALQVLEVREQVERAAPPGTPTISSSVSSVSNGVEGPILDMDDGEKALVREMCNVVWRKLEEGPAVRR